MIINAIQKNETFFNTVVYLTSSKINLVIFFNFLVVTLINLGNILVWIFFVQIRSIESKYIVDKSQKKIFHFLLLTLILRSTFDVYKFISLTILFFFWVLHWLVYKRSDYLISRGSRGKLEHAKLLVLYQILILIDFTVSYILYDKFQLMGDKMNEIYVIIGFEFVRLLLKAIQDNFKYTISLIELYYREQWTEKGFVFNIIGFIFDLIVLLLNIQSFPLYLLGEIIDTFVRLGKSIQLFIQSRQLINKLKKLPDVSAEEIVGMDNTCIICLEEIKKAKKLKCGHIFHLNCLRRWLEQNIQCPTCRDKIELDFNENAQNQRQQNVRRRRHRIRQQQPVPQLDNQVNQDADQVNQGATYQNKEESKGEGLDENATGGEKQQQKENKKERQKNSVKDIFKIDEDELMDIIEQDIMMHDLHGDEMKEGQFSSLSIENLKEESKQGDTQEQKENEEIKERPEDVYKELFEEKKTKQVKKDESLLHDELKFAKSINKTLFETSVKKGKEPSGVDLMQSFNPYETKIGSVAYGLPCLALTRRTLDSQLKSKQIEMINEKICRILRQPSEYVNINDSTQEDD